MARKKPTDRVPSEGYTCIDGYTAIQTMIIRGDIPPGEVDGRILKGLKARATKYNDEATLRLVESLEKPKENQKENYECIPGYSVKQSKLLRGEVSVDDVDGRLVYSLVNAAEKLGDTATLSFAKELLEQKHEGARRRNIERIRKRNTEKKNGTFQWKQPKSNEYTEHQKAIVRGEIPLEEVHAKELIHIHLKAKNAGDIELSERILSIVIDRQAAYEEEQYQRLARFHEARKAGVEQRRKDYKLTAWEKALLKCKVDFADCTIAHLKFIVDICRAQNDTERLAIAEDMLYFREHPESIYITTDKQEAIDIYERLMGKPVRRPETWFVDET